jgi:hypothetical protein
MTISPSSKISFAELKDDLKNLQFSPSIFINRRGSLAWWWPHMTKQLCLLVVCLDLKKGASTAWVFEKVDLVLRVFPHCLKCWRRCSTF